MFIIVALTLLGAGLGSSVWAAPVYLQCPYVLLNDERTVAIEAFSQAICTERGFARCGLQEPWAEQEIAEDAAIVYTDVSPTLADTITAATGCTVLNRGLLQADMARPPEERAMFRQRVRARDGKDIAPIPPDVLTRLEARVPVRESHLTRPLWRFAAWLVPDALAQLGTFPDGVTLVDDFNRADADPIGGDWTQINLADTDTGIALRIVSNELATPASGADGGVYLTTPLCAAACDAEVTTTNEGDVRLYARLTDTANSGDGYSVRQLAGTNNTTISRVDNGVATVLGAGIATTWAANDDLGLRVEDDDIAGYQNQAQLGTRTDATYAAVAAPVALSMTVAGDRVDNLSFRLVSTPVLSPAAVLLLRR